MNVEKLLSDYNIPFVAEGHQHVTEGWVNIHCPFCPGQQNYHLGISEDGTAAHCWRCGRHPITKVLSTALNVSPAQAKAILKNYRAGSKRRKIADAKVSIRPTKLPKPTYNNLTKISKEYLVNRAYNPEYLEREWGLVSTGPVSYLDGIDYGNRIIAPVYWNGEMVSFQGRDVTGKADIKYLTCPKKREQIHHKNILYCKQEELVNSSAVIIVEGITDVWRLGPKAAATFGIEFKMEQVLQLKNLNDRFFIVFDNDRQAQTQAKKLATKLRALRKSVYIKTVGTDPGDMGQDDADHLVRELLERSG